MKYSSKPVFSEISKFTDRGFLRFFQPVNLLLLSIYIQAKQWAPDRRVDRPEIQKFAGALQGEKATKGLFITTAKFSTGAKQYAENLHGSTIVLIDGTQLMKLMIKFNVGVSVDHVYEVKRIDTDFFNEGL